MTPRERMADVLRDIRDNSPMDTTYTFRLELTPGTPAPHPQTEWAPFRGGPRLFIERVTDAGVYACVSRRQLNKLIRFLEENPR